MTLPIDFMDRIKKFYKDKNEEMVVSNALSSNDFETLKNTLRDSFKKTFTAQEVLKYINDGSEDLYIAAIQAEDARLLFLELKDLTEPRRR